MTKWDTRLADQPETGDGGSSTEATSRLRKATRTAVLHQLINVFDFLVLIWKAEQLQQLILRL